MLNFIQEFAELALEFALDPKSSVLLGDLAHFAILSQTMCSTCDEYVETKLKTDTQQFELALGNNLHGLKEAVLQCQQARLSKIITLPLDDSASMVTQFL